MDDNNENNDDIDGVEMEVDELRDENMMAAGMEDENEEEAVFENVDEEEILREIEDDVVLDGDLQEELENREADDLEGQSDDEEEEVEVEGIDGDGNLQLGDDMERPPTALFTGFEELAGMRAPLESAPDKRAIDHLIMALAQSVRFNTSYEHLISQLQWIKESFVNINIPTTKKALWKVLGKDESNLIYRLYCEKCYNLVGNGKQVTIACRCGDCGPELHETHVATFVQIRLKPQLQDLLKSRKVAKGLQYKQTRVKMNDAAIEDIYDGSIYKSLSEDGQFLSNQNNFSFTIWTDGVSLAESSKASMWPILLQVNELSPHARKKHTLLAGLWIAKVKPCSALFLRPVVRDLVELYNIGIRWNHPFLGEIISKFITIIFTADSVARPMFLRMKQYNGFYGCTFCLAPGVQIDPAIPRRVYPAVPAATRTDQSIRNDAEVATNARREVNGVLGWSALANLPEFDLVDGIVVDICHNVYLGVVRKLLVLFMTGVGNEWYIGTERNIQLIDARIEKIKTPTRLSRRPRSISTYTMWKASEFRNWLLYYALPCLENILPAVYFNHLALLAKAVFILNNSSITLEEVNEAIRLLARFVSNFEELYGQVNMVYNIHLLTHLPNSVIKWGPTWVYSTFPFESMNKSFLDSVTSPFHRAEQIVLRFFMAKFVKRAIEEYNISPATKRKVEKLFKIPAVHVPPGMVEGQYFRGEGSRRVGRLTENDVRLVLYANLPIEEGVQATNYTKAVVNGVTYECVNAKEKKHCNHIAYCKNIGFIVIQKILSYVHENEFIAGFIGKRLVNQAGAYSTNYIQRVIASEQMFFSSYKNVIAPGIKIPTLGNNVAVHLCTIWETD